MAGSLRVCIQSSEPMSEEEIKFVELFLVRTIASTRPHAEGPKFLSLSYESGWILVTCKSQDNADYLGREIGNVKPWSEARRVCF